jgi:hypothetical protein
MIVSAEAVQWNGFGAALWALRQSRFAWFSSATERKTPRFRRRARPAFAPAVKDAPIDLVVTWPPFLGIVQYAE